MWQFRCHSEPSLTRPLVRACQAAFRQYDNSAVAAAAVVVNGWSHGEGGGETGDESDREGEIAIESEME